MLSEESESAISGIRICADSFDSFIYQFWVENEISMKLIGHDKTPLTEVERQYLDHTVSGPL